MARAGSLPFVALWLTAVTACGSDRSAVPTMPTPVIVPPGPAQPFEIGATPIEFVSYAALVHTPGVSWTGSIETVANFNDIWGRPFVFAPAGGTVTGVIPDGANFRLEVRAADRYHYYVTNLSTVNVALGATLQAGEVVGGRYAEPRFGRLAGVGVGVWREGVDSPFINPGRYPPEVAFAQNPLDLLATTLRDTVLALQVAPQKDGRISFDEAGTLMGFWFDEQVPVDAGLGAEYRDHRFWVFDTFDHDGACCGSRLRRVSTLNSFEPYGTPRSGTPDLRTITPASGLVVIEFEPPRLAPHWIQRVLVQMLAADRVRVEGYLGTPDKAPSGFTSAARTFVR